METLKHQQEILKAARSHSVYSNAHQSDKISGFNNIGNNGNNNNDRVCSSDTELTFNDVAGQSAFDPQLKEDFQTFKNMTLIDNNDFLDTLYLSASQFSNDYVASTTIITMYMDKYQKLFERYKGVGNYLLFVVICIMCNKYTDFLQIFQNLGRHGNNFSLIKRREVKISKFSLTRGKRSYQKPTTMTDLKAACNNNDQHEPLEKILKKDHPFLSTAFYNQYRILFHLGDLASRLLPSDFSIFAVNLEKCNVKMYGPQTKVSTKMASVPGLLVSFNVPILFTLTERVVKGEFSYYSVNNSQALDNYLKLSINKQMYALNCGVKKTQQFASIKKLTNVIDQFNVQKNVLNNKFVVLDRFHLWLNDNNDQVVTSRSFCETVYYIESDMLKMHTETDTNDEDDPRSLDILAKYYESEGIGTNNDNTTAAPSVLVPSTSETTATQKDDRHDNNDERRIL